MLGFLWMLQLPILCGGHPALSDVTPCLLRDFFENSGGTTTPPSVTALHQVILSHKYCTPPPIFVHLVLFLSV